jgi:hypothetical protein
VLHLLGGTSRSGKTTIARRLVQEKAIPYSSLDVLVMGLGRGWPGDRVDLDATDEARARILWPVIRAMAVNLLDEERTHPTYLLEGIVLFPQGVAELAAEYPGRVRTCFLGYLAVDPPTMLRRVRAVEPDWYYWAPDSDALAFLAEQVELSRCLARQCAERGLPYVDVSQGLPEELDDAIQRLVGH